MQTADRLSKIPPYLFVTLRNKINKARSEGVDVISLGVGDPVDPTPQSVIDELCRQAQVPINHQYPIDEEKGMLAFRQEVANWYRKRYGVELNPEGEVVGLIGSKEGCHHFVLGVANPGDVVLMTSPGYPGYRASIYMGNAEPYEMPILDDGNYLPDFDKIPSEIVKRAKAMFLNYPNNPTGACATREFFGKVVEFAKAHDIAVCHDNPYSEVVFDGQERLSFLAVPGAKDVGIELNSLSKPYNMTGMADRHGHGQPADHCRDLQGQGKYRFGHLQRDSVRGDRRPPERRRQHRQDDGHLLPPPEAGSGYV